MMRAYATFIAAMVILSGVGSFAQAQDAPKYDTDKPIEITADTLEVLQNEQKAVFKGHVIAIQGKIHITSDSMTVHYRTGDQKKEGAQAISKIVVKGNVLLATPEESAKGDTGIYNVDENKITLTGHVVLTKGENVVQGEHLEYDLKTGKSQIGGGVGAVANPAEPGQPAKGRVRGLFVPKSNE